MPFSDQERVNKSVWADLAETFAQQNGWIDNSERVLASRLTEEYAGGRILDIGVGGGRTIPLLTRHTADYVAIDFIPELVEVSRKRFPDVDVRVGDARALEFADSTFDLVMFSINGIDAIPHEDRETAMGEISRVLAPGGTFLFSTHNLDGPGPNEHPYSIPPVRLRQPRSSVRKMVNRVTHYRQAVQNYEDLRGSSSRGPGWEITTSGAHDFGILVHYVSPPLLIDELRNAGFAGDIEIWDDVAGVEISGDRRRQRRAYYLNVVALRS